MAHQVEELFVRDAISLTTFRALVRQCHEALRAEEGKSGQETAAVNR